MQLCRVCYCVACQVFRKTASCLSFSQSAVNTMFHSQRRCVSLNLFSVCYILRLRNIYPFISGHQLFFNLMSHRKNTCQHCPEHCNFDVACSSHQKLTVTSHLNALILVVFTVFIFPCLPLVLYLLTYHPL